MQNCLLSIVIPAFNEAHDLPGLLASVRPLLDDGRAQVVVVDNGSTDETSRVATAHEGVEVVRIGRTTVGAARNAGARAATGRVLAFLDADIIVTESWTAAICELASTAGWGSEVTGDVCDVSQHPSWLERHWFGSIYRRGARHYINSGNLALSRTDFVNIGGFDESLLSGEDAELCLRAVDTGMRLAPRRSLHVHHLGFPRTLAQFMKRETWHGRGDFVSFATMRASPVAQVTLGFVALHVLVLFSAGVGQPVLAIGSVAAVGGLCAACSFWKFRQAPLRSRVVNAAVYYCYFLGRARSAWRSLARSA